MKAAWKRFIGSSVFVVLMLVPASISVPFVQSQTQSAANGIAPALLAKANSGDAHSQTAIGLAYAGGKSVPQDFVRAAEWLRKAAEQGNGVAEIMLGSLYQGGDGVPQDFAQAAIWYRKAAEQGMAKAQISLGLLYRDGKGVPQDYGQAMSLFRKAANQGDPEAEYSLAVLYDDGKGVPQDTSKAIAWYRKAAEQGLTEAQINLGIVLFAHSGNRLRTIEEAYMWLDVAAARTTHSAQQQAAAKARDEVASQLPPFDLKRGQKRAEKWVTQHPNPSPTYFLH